MYYCKSIRLAGRLNLFFFAGCYLVDLDTQLQQKLPLHGISQHMTVDVGWSSVLLVISSCRASSACYSVELIPWLGLPFIRIFERRHVMIDVSNVLVVTYYQLCWGWKLSVNNTGLAKLDEDGQWLVKSVCFHIDECFILNMRPIFSNPVIL